MVRRTLKQSMARDAEGEATALYTRTEIMRRPPAVAKRRVPRVPAYVTPEQEGSLRAAQAALREQPRRGWRVYAIVLCALVLLDGLTFARIAGWWDPVDVVPQGSVPGIFVPATLRVLSHGAPSEQR